MDLHHSVARWLVGTGTVDNSALSASEREGFTRVDPAAAAHFETGLVRKLYPSTVSILFEWKDFYIIYMVFTDLQITQLNT